MLLQENTGLFTLRFLDLAFNLSSGPLDLNGTTQLSAGLVSGNATADTVVAKNDGICVPGWCSGQLKCDCDGHSRGASDSRTIKENLQPWFRAASFKTHLVMATVPALNVHEMCTTPVQCFNPRRQRNRDTFKALLLHSGRCAGIRAGRL